MVIQQTLSIKTSGRGTRDMTREVEAVVSQSNMHAGFCNVFLRHTSASLILCENADPTVRRDLETFMHGWRRMAIPCLRTTPRGRTTCRRTCARS